MIITCPACGTKYRLEADQIEEEVWLRCTRCHHVFMPEWMQEKKELEGDVLTEEIRVVKERKKNPSWMWILGPIFILFVVIAAFFALYQPGEKGWVSFLGKTLPERGQRELSAPFQIKITDLRQYFVENAMLGKIRVVQGAIINTSPKFMTRIKVKAELYDVLGVRVLEGYAYCGNILTEQELSTAPEEEITRRLLQPLGQEVSTEKVPPQGVIPFMVVLTREPPGVEKTFVQAVEAEYLLP